MCWWWQHTGYAAGGRPFVIFISQDEDQRNRFLDAADGELTGQLWHPSAASDEKVFMWRQRVIFACELDMHLGRLEARRVPGVPPGDARRHDGNADIRPSPPARPSGPTRATRVSARGASPPATVSY